MRDGAALTRCVRSYARRSSGRVAPRIDGLTAMTVVGFRNERVSAARPGEQVVQAAVVPGGHFGGSGAGRLHDNCVALEPRGPAEAASDPLANSQLPNQLVVQETRRAGHLPSADPRHTSPA